MGAAEKILLSPQAGPQHQFCASQADIVIYGGAAGGGKTFGLIIDPLRHFNVQAFGGVIFRRTSVQIRNKGGLWDESTNVYSLFRARPRESFLKWIFPSGMTMGFAHLEHEKDIYNYQGAQIPYIGFDELTHFTERQFFYMLTRNRSMTGIRARVRAGCNPDPDSWVKRFILWWLDANGEFPDYSKSGIIRWFIRENEQIIWGDSAQELIDKYGKDKMPKSVTFIPARLDDNKIFVQKDPTYRANLLSQTRVDRERLLHGNWKVRASAGMLFQREWFEVLPSIPGGWIGVCRFWDRAASKPSDSSKDPDWTRGLKLYKYPNGTYVVGDLRSARDTPGQIDDIIRNVASQDGPGVRIKAQQDPGSAGVAEIEYFTRNLAGYDVRSQSMSKDKVTRAKPVSAQAEFGNVKVVAAPWNDEFFTELENFSDNEDDYAHDDIVDALSGAFNELCGGFSTVDVASKLMPWR